MKKLTAALLLGLCLSLTACGPSGGEDMDPSEPEANVEGAAETEQAGDEVNHKEDHPLSDKILINQIGYLPDEKKRVVLKGENMPDSFHVVREDDGETVFSSYLMGQQYDAASGEECAYGDFSSCSEPGMYYIVAGEWGRSYSFPIGDAVYHEVLQDALRVFYAQRCGSRLDGQYAGKYAHEACHMEDAKLTGAGEGTLDVTGGWHDGGDYGRYVVTGAHAAADLMLGYSYFPDAFTDDMGIAESGNGVPDLLDEVRYEMEWLLKMQDDSGGVYHKVTTADPDGDPSPEAAEELYISPVSTAATGNFAAALAMFSTLYEQYDKAFAGQCLSAAEKAWGYLLANPENAMFKNPEGIHTPEYANDGDGDERFWAAAQLYKATGKQTYHQYILDVADDQEEPRFGYHEVGGFGYLAYLTTVNKTDLDTCNLLMDRLLKYTETILHSSQKDAYFTSLQGNYAAESNDRVSENAAVLAIMNQLSISAEYQDSISGHAAYLFGANPLNMSYVTGYGSAGPQQPCSPLYELTGEALPGMLVSGPDANAREEAFTEQLSELPDAEKYIDDSKSCATNKVSVCQNAALVFLVSGLQ